MTPALRTIGIAAGAGLASALLFAASAKGGALALVIAYVTPLPIMIAALGFGQATGLLAAGVACCGIAVLLGVLAGGFFGVLIGFPSWWLGYLLLLARPVTSQSGQAATSIFAWYPLGRVVAWGAAIVIGAVLAVGAAVVIHYGGYAATLASLTAHLKNVLIDVNAAERSFSESSKTVVRLLPALMGGSTFLMLMVNLWLAARVVQASGLLSRPWPALPENLRLPRAVAFVFLAAGIAVFAGGLVGVASGVIVAPFGVAFILQGLGAAHTLTRGLAARRLILFTIYFITLSIVPSLLALAVLGVVDCLLPLRRTQPPTPSPTAT
ncbi:DUF2232 domain-containing protein [Lichenifustis flavocetrariae]|uniref:YybS family protein n=1 Tax=Lichenifustis flavocetrariae TaxID=2949735 RepID=A0AA41YV52_9HYPH|nr:DUF2232 domain-containing protein [Lichenifustis flavocetrariae]MCW6509141.1 YybS family protein [Lichenifustis flavocetrariae]